MDQDKKVSSKTFKFFEWLFALVVTNLITIFLIVPIFTAFSAITTLIEVLKDFSTEGPASVIKTYFITFGKNFKRSIVFGIINTIILALIILSLYFYGFLIKPEAIIGQIGFWFTVGITIFFIFINLQLPFVFVNFPYVGVFDGYKFSLFVSFRHFLNTMLVLACFLLAISGIVLFPIWICIGVSGSAFLAVKITDPIYYYLKKIIERDENKDNEEE